ncbi:hypothetical protein MKW94_027175 [Papaver nudicaule]|uniref:Uncharacterized protein n=1 Tax=Papaver nudicaule TaxID=74823 RepID=A0AA41S1D4_PAPNU|nr:hypothetical protein [Papaver nudicaule]
MGLLLRLSIKSQVTVCSLVNTKYGTYTLCTQNIVKVLPIGSRLYRLIGLKSSIWYEVKISYPASLLMIFQLIRDKLDNGHNWNRRLLNTEKLIFKADIYFMQSLDQSENYVLVSVESAGVVAIPGVNERELIKIDLSAVRPSAASFSPHQCTWIMHIKRT